MQGRAFVYRPLALALFALLALLALVLVRIRPPAPLSATAAPDRFSAKRAAKLLEEILPKEPHPVGSQANARFREAIVARLRALGLAPEEQRVFVCGDYASCAPVTNVVVRLPGRTNEPAVALVAHYDSVSAGPGAGDDGSGVGILLEVARALSTASPLRRPVVLVFTDAEEVGLLGARAFVDRHPLSRDIHAVVNVEARGTRGPSLLFEARGAEAGLVERYAKAAPHPVTSSLFSSAYERMPNDSDLSVFARAGIAGINLGFIGEVSHYHTPLDDLANLDLRSLQDQGDHALSMVRALAEDDVALSAGRSVYFDVLALGIVRYPAYLSLPLSLVTLLAASVLPVVLSRRRRLSLGAALRGFGAFCLAILVSLLTAWGLKQALFLSGVTKTWLAHPWPCIFAFVSIGLLCAALALSLTKEALGHWAGTFLGWAVLAVLVSLLEPRAAYLFLVPSLGYLVAAPSLALSSRWHVTAFLLPALVAGLVLFPVLAIVYEAVGSMALPAYAVTSALVAGTVLPLACDIPARVVRRGTYGLAAAIVVLAVTTALLPKASVSRPERMSLALLDDTDGEKRWLAYPESGRLPASLASAAAFGSKRIRPLPWSGELAYAARAEVTGKEPPRVTVESLDAGTARLRAKPVRAGESILLAFPVTAAPEYVRVEGEPVRSRQEGAFRVLRLFGLPPEGVEVELGGVRQGSEAVVLAMSPGLPGEAAALLRARPDWAVPSHEGDRWMVWQRVALGDR